jgi:hypothetical protein
VNSNRTSYHPPAVKRFDGQGTRQGADAHQGTENTRRTSPDPIHPNWWKDVKTASGTGPGGRTILSSTGPTFIQPMPAESRRGPVDSHEVERCTGNMTSRTVRQPRRTKPATKLISISTRSIIRRRTQALVSSCCQKTRTCRILAALLLGRPLGTAVGACKFLLPYLSDRDRISPSIYSNRVLEIRNWESPALSHGWGPLH